MIRQILLTGTLLLIGSFVFADNLVQAAEIQSSSLSKEWVIVMHDPRSSRRQAGGAGLGYASTGIYHSDPKLQRASRRLANDYQLTIIEQWPIRNLGVYCLVASLPEGRNIADMIKEITADKRVESMQPMNQFDVLAQNTDQSAEKVDPYQDLQASLTQLNVMQAQKYVTGKGVTVAIIDSGIDEKHPDLQEVIAWQENFVDEMPSYPEQHGTGIAGVIAAKSHNGVGIMGVAPEATLYGLRACWQESNSPKARCNTLTLSLALDRVIDEQPGILNLSLTGPDDPLLERLLKKIIEQKTIVVSAYDEKRKIKDRFPTAQAGVIYGRSGEWGLDAPEAKNISGEFLPAPAKDVLTLQPSQTYDALTGNSLAAAHLSGAIALLLEAKPDLNIDALKSILTASIKHQNDVASIDICNALSEINQNVVCKEAL